MVGSGKTGAACVCVANSLPNTATIESAASSSPLKLAAEMLAALVLQTPPGFSGGSNFGGNVSQKRILNPSVELRCQLEISRTRAGARQAKPTKMSPLNHEYSNHHRVPYADKLFVSKVRSQPSEIPQHES